MARDLHIIKSSGGWDVTRSGSRRSLSEHRTRADAIAAGRRLALKSGGAELVVHRADGRVRDRDTVGAARLDALKRSGEVVQAPQPRAPRSVGPRTTLRLPDALAGAAARLARELGISRNDALLRLATRGAQLYEQEQRIEARRAERWAAVVPGVIDLDHAEFPSLDEASNAVLAARDQAAAPAR